MLDGYQRTFIIQEPSPALRTTILNTCEAVVTLPKIIALAAEIDLVLDQLETSSTVVLDGYHFDTQYQRALRAADHRVVFIDDIQHCHFEADAVINQAVGLTADQFSIASHTELCLGAAYALLRPPFREAPADKKRTELPLRRVFVCFGGADFNNLSLKALQRLIELPDLRHIDLVLGSAYRQEATIANLLDHSAGHSPTVSVHCNLTATAMAATMRASDVAIVPASGILYEALALDCPVITGYYVDNQHKMYGGIVSTGAVVGVGDFNHFEGYASVLSSLDRQQLSELTINREQLDIQSATANFRRLFNRLRA